jgi:chemotaxis family two-component system response regulator PixG
MPYLERYAAQNLTGCLRITFTPVVTIDLYFNLGRFAWVTGGIHPIRRLKRQLTRHCADAMVNPVQLRPEDRTANWGYNLLLMLMRRGLVNQPTLNELIRSITLEVLFDLWQEFTLQPHTQRPPVSLTEHPGARPSERGILPAQSTLHIQSLVTESLTQWQSWQQANLTRCSPNLAPRILNPQALAQAVSSPVYQNFSRLMNGQRSLRDIAAVMQQDPLRVARSLSPYIQQRLLGVGPISDLPISALFAPVTPSNPAPSNPAPSNPTPSDTAPLVACIDDSPHLCHLMGELLTDAGYRFLPINDPLKALPLLIQHRPEVIFLDLMMPIANGYEICAQIQRASTLKNTPVVILTAQDGVVDRVRAKLVGATAFLSKPIDSAQVLSVLKQFTDTAMPT